MGLFDDLRRELAQALEAAREAAEAGQSAPAPRPGNEPLLRPAARVRGHLQREPLERVAPAPPAIPPAEPTGDDFRRKVEAPGTPRFDLGGADAPTSPLSLTPHDLLRSLLLGEVLDEPKGRRARRPHPR